MGSRPASWRRAAACFFSATLAFWALAIAMTAFPDDDVDRADDSCVERAALPVGILLLIHGQERRIHPDD